MATALETDDIPLPPPPMADASGRQLREYNVKLHLYLEALRRDLAALRDLHDTEHP